MTMKFKGKENGEKVESGFRRLPGLRNPWKLICSITDVGRSSQ